MAKKALRAGAMLGPVPAALVSCGDREEANLITVAWTGILATNPPKTYISVRPKRHSYNIIKESGEFVINLTTSKMVRETDFCGVRSGKDMDKIKKCNLHLEPASKVGAPIISESPLSLECRVVEVKQLGTHDMFLAEIVAVSVDGHYLDSKGKINLTETVVEFLLLELPSQFFCKDTCKGICPDCGVNLNHSECKCKSKAVDPRLGALADLLKEMEDEE